MQPASSRVAAPSYEERTALAHRCGRASAPRDPPLAEHERGDVLPVALERHGRTQAAAVVVGTKLALREREELDPHETLERRLVEALEADDLAGRAPGGREVALAALEARLDAH